MRGFKTSNEYSEQLGRLFAQTPKHVLAAIAVSPLVQQGHPPDEIQAAIRHEWQTLYDNRIVTQRPPR